MAYRIYDAEDPKKMIKIEKAEHSLSVAVVGWGPGIEGRYFTLLLRPEMLYRLGRSMTTGERFFLHRNVSVNEEEFIVTFGGQRQGSYYVVELESRHSVHGGRLRVVVPMVEADVLGHFIKAAAGVLFLTALWSKRGNGPLVVPDELVMGDKLEA